MRKILLWTGVGIVALVIVFVGIAALQEQSHQNQRKKLANTFVQDVLAGNADDSYNLFSTSAQNTQTTDDWNAQVSKLSSFFKGKSPHLDKINTTQNSTEVDYSITGKDGNYIFTVTLVTSKAGLQVQSFTSLLSLQ